MKQLVLLSLLLCTAFSSFSQLYAAYAPAPNYLTVSNKASFHPATFKDIYSERMAIGAIIGGAGCAIGGLVLISNANGWPFKPVHEIYNFGDFIEFYAGVAFLAGGTIIMAAGTIAAVVLKNKHSRYSVVSTPNSMGIALRL